MPHEIAISPDGRQAAVVAYGGRTIDIFDVAHAARSCRTIDLSPNEGPHGIVWLPDGRILATTERSQSLTIVDTSAGDAVSAIPTGQQGTHMVAVSPDRRRAYTANIGSGTVSVLDLDGGDEAARHRGRRAARGDRAEPDGRTLWVGDLQGARVQAFDTRSFERLAEVRTGRGADPRAASPDGRWIVTSNLGCGCLTIIDARTRARVREIAVSGSDASRQVTHPLLRRRPAALRRRDRPQPGRRDRSGERPGAAPAAGRARRATGWRSRPEGRRARSAPPHHG